jgi:hypothetical protein
METIWLLWQLVYLEIVINFFSLTGDGVWENSASFNTGIDSAFHHASLSGKTAFVETNSAEVGTQILVYEQNTASEWEEVQHPIEFEDDVDLVFVSCDLDGDLACITDRIYGRTGNKWIHFDTKNGSACTIYGNTVAIEEIYLQENITTIQKHLFKYNEIQNALFPIQDPILSQYCRSNDYLAFLDDCDEALYIYRLDPESETYTFHQQISMEGVFPLGIEMNNDVLAVAEFNHNNNTRGLNRYQLLAISSVQMEKSAHTALLRTVPNQCQHLLLRASRRQPVPRIHGICQAQVIRKMKMVVEMLPRLQTKITRKQ